MLTFFSFDTESNYDHVSVYDGGDINAALLGEFHGSSVPSDQTASGSQLFVKLESDGSVEGDGFTATFECPGADSSDCGGGGGGSSVATFCGSEVLVDSGALDGTHTSSDECTWALSCSDASQVRRRASHSSLVKYRAISA